jgi:putative hydrolase of the HAD superfamily
MLKWIVFDFADTLYDHNLIRRKFIENKSLSRILAKFNLKVSEKKIARLMENIRISMQGRIERHSGQLVFKKIGEAFNKKFTQNQLNEMEKLYRKQELKYFKLLPGALEVVKLAKKKGLKLALISNMSSELFAQKLAKSGLSENFNIKITSTEVGGEKSSLFPFMVFLARANKLIETKPEEVLIVGDRIDEDVNAAILGMRTVLFQRRNSKFKAVHGLQPDFKIKNLKQLKKIIIQLT